MPIRSPHAFMPWIVTGFPVISDVLVVNLVLPMAPLLLMADEPIVRMTILPFSASVVIVAIWLFETGVFVLWEFYGMPTVSVVR